MFFTRADIQMRMTAQKKKCMHGKARSEILNNSRKTKEAKQILCSNLPRHGPISASPVKYYQMSCGNKQFVSEKELCFL